jgi:hypothetical protein
MNVWMNAVTDDDDPSSGVGVCYLAHDAADAARAPALPSPPGKASQPFRDDALLDLHLFLGRKQADVLSSRPMSTSRRSGLMWTSRPTAQ